MRQNTAPVVDLATVRRQREQAQAQEQPKFVPMVMVWMPVWFYLPYQTMSF